LFCDISSDFAEARSSNLLFGKRPPVLTARALELAGDRPEGAVPTFAGVPGRTRSSQRRAALCFLDAAT